MANYMEYLSWRGDLTFDKAPFNEIDSAVLAEISYLPFEYLDISSHEISSLREALTALTELDNLEELVTAEYHLDLIKALLSGNRFIDLPILEFRNIFDESHVVQFTVITIQMEPELYYVSFRGTNHTLIGWQEDFNMGVKFPVLSQKLAAIYLNGLSVKTAGELILGGHSKGGNLAVYAGAFCKPGLQKRIRTIYNFDGPGFESWIMAQPAYLEIADRIRTFVPQSSIIGMLLEQAEGYQVVRSVESGGFAQHLMTSWEVQRDHFVKLESVTDKSLFLDAAITEWIRRMDYEQRQTFVDVLFSIFKDANVQSLGEISPKRIRQMLSFIRSYRSLDHDNRSHMGDTIVALFRCVREEAPAYGMEGFRLLWRK